jgi:hypothetical protein
MVVMIEVVMIMADGKVLSRTARTGLPYISSSSPNFQAFRTVIVREEDIHLLLPR